MTSAAPAASRPGRTSSLSWKPRSLRKRAWQGREVPLEPESWDVNPSASLGPAAASEQTELLGAVRAAIAEALTPHQRKVLVALAINGVPIDVLAERLNSNRGALYK